MAADIHRCARAEVVLSSGTGNGFHIVVTADGDELLHVQAESYSWLRDPEGTTSPGPGEPPGTEGQAEEQDSAEGTPAQVGD